MRFAAIAMLAAIVSAWSVSPPARAQDMGVVQSEILVIDPDRLFAETQLGARLSADYQARRDRLSAKNRQLERELEAQEQALTDLRSEKTAEEFKKLADEFDVKVQNIRRRSDQAVRNLELSRERAPLIFMNMVEPILIELMSDAGGSVLLVQRNVLLSANVVDITGLAISRIDREIGAGPDTLNLPEIGDSPKDVVGTGAPVAPELPASAND